MLVSTISHETIQKQAEHGINAPTHTSRAHKSTSRNSHETQWEEAGGHPRSTRRARGDRMGERRAETRRRNRRENLLGFSLLERRRPRGREEAATTTTTTTPLLKARRWRI
ncbi:hypothetical protein DAI22_04g198701 [Oryza sativa Japonica Group]|nr:hypothetical protein DAI22_04g198701 [Oryza sativa Japonica Group]